MDPLIYCLFMLSCFGSPREQTVLLKCPEHCECYQASLDGIGRSDAESFVCTDLTFLSAYSFNTKLINTFVLRNVPFQKEEYNFANTNKKYQTISLFLENLSHSADQTNNAKYIFNLFDHRSLKYLTILKSPDLSLFDWTSLGSFANLEIINIDSSKLPTLDESFASLKLDKLHTLIIKSSSLDHIDREALVDKPNLRKVTITNNAIRNWNWLTSLAQPLKELWHLDLTSNRLTYIPEDLKSVLPNLRVFHLAHNRLRYFSYSAMQPWLAIDEFQPANKNPLGTSSKSSYNYIFYTKDIEQILETPEITAEYFGESLTKQIHYVCTVPSAATNWNDFSLICRLPSTKLQFNYLPDNLQMKQASQLDRHLEAYPNDGDVKAANVFIRGLDLGQSSPTNPGDQLFYFDSTSTQAKYRENRAYLMNQLNSMIGQKTNAIRLHLFGKTMLNYFLGKSTITKEHIRLTIDLVVEYLDEAAERKFYVMLIMWNHSDVIDTLRGQSLNYKNSQNIFKDTVLLSLLKRISSHSALIGIEIMNQFLSNEIPPGTAVDFDATSRCNPLQWANLPQIAFLGTNAQMVKQNSGQKLIGLSVDSNCPDCFQIGMRETCRRRMEFTVDNGYDFITFINTAKVDTYSYLNHQHYPVWLNKPDDTQSQMGSYIRGVFHVIQQATLTEDEINLKMNNDAASGLFVVQ